MPLLRISGPSTSLLGYKYFWCKKVRAVNLAHHCAKSLVGPYDKTFGDHMPTNVDLPLPYDDGDILYICGVTRPYRWEDNFHLAVEIDHDNDTRPAVTLPLVRGQTLTLRGARMLPFDDKAARRTFPDFGADFLTCRNFQFAVHAHAAGFLPTS